MKNLVLSWPIFSCFVFFAIQIFAFEGLAAFSKEYLGSSAQHLAFALRIVTALIFWWYLLPDWSQSFHLDLSSLPVALVLLTAAYTLFFFPWPLQSAAFPAGKVSLHLLIST